MLFQVFSIFLYYITILDTEKHKGEADWWIGLGWKKRVETSEMCCWQFATRRSFLEAYRGIYSVFSPYATLDTASLGKAKCHYMQCFIQVYILHTCLVCFLLNHVFGFQASGRRSLTDQRSRTSCSFPTKRWANSRAFFRQPLSNCSSWQRNATTVQQRAMGQPNTWKLDVGGIETLQNSSTLQVLTWIRHITEVGRHHVSVVYAKCYTHLVPL